MLLLLVAGEGVGSWQRDTQTGRGNEGAHLFYLMHQDQEEQPRVRHSQH